MAHGTAMVSADDTRRYQLEAEHFYKNVLEILTTSKTSFVIAGTYAMKHYTGIDRPTKDLDVFVMAGDYPKLLKLMSQKGYTVAVEDERWLARVLKGRNFIDVIFGSIPGVWPIGRQWFDRSQKGEVLGVPVQITPPEELIVSKAYRMKRDAFDGADVSHLILKQGKHLDWKHLLNRMDPYWEILLIHILLFRFTYPSEREQVPREVLDELLERLRLQMELPTPVDKVSRGSVLSWSDYKDAIKKWGFKDMTEYTFEGKDHV